MRLTCTSGSAGALGGNPQSDPAQEPPDPKSPQEPRPQEPRTPRAPDPKSPGVLSRLAANPPPGFSEQNIPARHARLPTRSPSAKIGNDSFLNPMVEPGLWQPKRELLTPATRGFWPG